MTEYLTAEEAAKYLGISIGAFKKFRAYYNFLKPDAQRDRKGVWSIETLDAAEPKVRRLLSESKINQWQIEHLKDFK